MEWVNHLTEQGTMKPAAELRALFEAHGVTPDKRIIALCQTGYRSAHAYLALRPQCQIGVRRAVSGLA